jgi:hypothetical protein
LPFHESGLIRGVTFCESGLIRGVDFCESGLKSNKNLFL